MRPRSLYVHVPFCARRCSYCDFAVEATREPPTAEWLQAITAELALTSAEQGWDEPLELDTLYVGGGTPSLLGVGAMSRLRDSIADHAVLSPGAEWTCEANPESFSPTLADDWLRAGVNRVSLGVQTFDAGALRWMGRLHGPDGPRRAVEAARQAGIDNVSIDLIFGLPDRLQRDWRRDLERAVSLAPEHVSLYGLTAEAGAPLGRWVEEGREHLAGEDRYADEYLLAHHLLVEAGYEHYEVSNFSRPGLHSRHNFAYWTGEAYAAAGPGAHAFLPPRRRWNLRSWSAYREALQRGTLPCAGEETLEPDSAGLEYVWLRLRTSRGMPADELGARQWALAGDWERRGLARVGDRVRLTAEGWLLLDRVALDLHEARDTVSLSGADRRGRGVRARSASSAACDGAHRHERE